MAVMLPDELVWVLQKLGFEWPDVDEDELRRGAEIVRTFSSDMDTIIQSVDRKVNGDLTASMRGQTGPAYVSAWNTNRSQNLQKMLDLLDPAATGVDAAATGVTALKTKVIIEVTTTLIQLIPLLAGGPFTAAGAAGLIIVKKRLMNVVFDLALEQVLAQVLPMVIEPMMNELPAIIDAVLDHPMVEANVGDSDEFYADLEALETAEAEMETSSADVSTVTQTFLADLSSLDLGGDV